MHAASHYHFDWDRILRQLRSGNFFFPDNPYAYPGQSITGEYLSDSGADELGEAFIQQLAALAASLDLGNTMANALHLEGLTVDRDNLRMIPLENPVSATEEEDGLTALVKRTGITDAVTVLKHIADANSLYVGQKYHPSLNESRSLMQCLIDNIGDDTHKSGAHSNGFPGGTANRIKYLLDVGFFTPDETSAFSSAWGALSAGSHPGVPAREEARIGLILALEFGQLLLLKFENWKAGSYKTFVRR